MAKFAAGQIVSLRSGRICKITKVANDSQQAHEVVYLVELNANEKNVPVGEPEVLAISEPHLWNRQKRGLTEFESDVLDKYTGPTFREWNKALREGKTPSPEIEALQSLLGKSPKYTGYVYRGLEFKSVEEVGNFAARFEKGRVYTTPQFMSTSRSNAAAMSFCGPNFGAFMRIYTDGKDGAVLREFTGTKDLGENEVLFRYQTHYDVESADFGSGGKQFSVQLTLQGATRPAELFGVPEFRGAPKERGPDPGKGNNNNQVQGKGLRISQ